MTKGPLISDILGHMERIVAQFGIELTVKTKVPADKLTRPGLFGLFGTEYNLAGMTPPTTATEMLNAVADAKKLNATAEIIYTTVNAPAGRSVGDKGLHMSPVYPNTTPRQWGMVAAHEAVYHAWTGNLHGAGKAFDFNGLCRQVDASIRVPAIDEKVNEETATDIRVIITDKPVPDEYIIR